MIVSLKLLKNIFIITTILASFSAHAVIQNCSQGVNFSNGNTYKQLSGTISCVLRKNPRIKTQSVSLKSGKKHGKSITYGGFYRRKDSAKNHIAMIENFHNGKKHGKFIIYDEKLPSKINVEKDYKNGVQQREMRFSVFNGGKTITYYAPKGKWSSKIGSLSYNKAGQLSNKSCPKVKSHVPELNKVCGFGDNAQAVTLRDNSGKITTTAVIKQGQAQERKTYYASGKLRSKATPHLTQTFYENGKLKKEKIGNPKQALTIKEYFPTGTKKSLERSNNNHVITEERTWYMNGKPKRVELHQPKTRVVSVKAYYGNGQLQESFQFIRNGRYKKTYFGKAQFFYENGRPSEESVRDNKGKMLSAKVYYFNGPLMKFTVVHGDNSRTVKEYDKNGSLQKTATYYSDGSVK